METEFVRKPSCLEAFYMDLDDCGFNMTFHYYLRLDRQPDPDALNAALQKTLEANPGMDLAWKKNGWHLSSLPNTCATVHAACGDICDYRPARLDFRRHTLGVTLLHLVESGQWHLCFDFFHGAVDGRSGIQFVYDFFSALRGETPQAGSFTVMDDDIIRENPQVKARTRIPLWPRCVPDGWVPAKDGDYRSHVVTTNACRRFMAARLSSAVGKCFRGGRAHMIVPVDIRRFARSREGNLFGNLVLPIFPNAHTRRQLGELHGEIISSVKEKTALAANVANLFFYNRLPVALRQAVLRFLIPLVMGCRKFICCALVSPIGAMDEARLKSDVCDGVDLAVTFISFPFAAFTVTSVQFGGRTNTVVCWHSGRVSQEAAGTLIENIQESMAEESVPV